MDHRSSHLYVYSSVILSLSLSLTFSFSLYLPPFPHLTSYPLTFPPPPLSLSLSLSSSSSSHYLIYNKNVIMTTQSLHNYKLIMVTREIEPAHTYRKEIHSLVTYYYK